MIATLRIEGIKINLSIEKINLHETMGMDFFGVLVKHLPKKYYLKSVFMSGQMFGPVADSLSLCSAVLLLHDPLFRSVDLSLLLTNFPVMWNIL